MENKNKKYKVTPTENIELEQSATGTCPECGSLLVEYSYGIYREAECKGCGYTETARPLISHYA